MSALVTLTKKLADRLEVGMENSTELMNVLKNTAFKSKETISDAQLTALMVVANQYGLNPWTKEIYAYPDKNNGIVPVVGVDGWSRIINEHAQLDGIEFHYSETTVTHKGKTCHEWIECAIFRKDRSRPIVIRERFEEVVRTANFPTPWDTHPSRMHRHKTLIQASRVAFGFAGIYDQDEAERIMEAKDITPGAEVQVAQTQSLPAYPQERIDANSSEWRSAIEAGKATPEALIAKIESGYTLTDQQKKQIQKLQPIEATA